MGSDQPAYHPGVDNLRAVPRPDIYGETYARSILAGEFSAGWRAPSGVTSISFQFRSGGSSNGGGGNSYVHASSNAVISGRVAMGGSGGVGGSNSAGGNGSSGWGGGWSSTYGCANSVASPSDLLAGGSC